MVELLVKLENNGEVEKKNNQVHLVAKPTMHMESHNLEYECTHIVRKN